MAAAERLTLSDCQLTDGAIVGLDAALLARASALTLLDLRWNGYLSLACRSHLQEAWEAAGKPRAGLLLELTMPM